MLRRFTLVVLVTTIGWTGIANALGLGDIRLSSALNEPLEAEITLLSASAEELSSLKVSLASQQTFERYGLDRPAFLSDISFDVDNGVIKLTSNSAITEPFVTILVEAVWPRGRLLREYTVLLDPPVFRPQAQPAPAPRQQAQDNNRRIQRAPQSRPQSRPAPSYDGDSYTVRRSDTLWQIAERVRPASDISINQVMLALYEANPQAFNGNINLVNAGATLRVPSAEEMYRRNRGDALSEVRRQNQAWRGGRSSSEGTLRLVPPDDSSSASAAASSPSSSTSTGSTVSPQSGDVRALQSELAEADRLLSAKNQELADLRARLEALEAATDQQSAQDDTSESSAETSPGVDLETGDGGEEIFVDNSDEPVDSESTDSQTEEPVASEPEKPAAVVTTPAKVEESFVDKVLGWFSSIWSWVALAVVALLAGLVFLARRSGGGDDDSTGTWEALDDFEDDGDADTEATSRLRALASEDDSIVVVESEQSNTVAPGASAVSSQSDNYSIENTFSSETAINLDQSDPVAEADFHMAYGLYDQAADLINGAIAAEPERRDLKEKLAEIYFVWGNQDGFVAAAEQVHGHVTDDTDDAWDKIKIMGQQIAPSHALFAGAAAASLDSVDLDFAADDGGVSEIDVDFASEDGASEIFESAGDDDALDFEFTGTNVEIEEDDLLDLDTGGLLGEDESPTIERNIVDDNAATQENPTVNELSIGSDDAATQETPTIESPAVSSDDTAEMQIRDLTDDRAAETAEINLDDLGLDLSALDASGEQEALVDMSGIEDELDLDSSIETLGIDPESLDQIGDGADDDLADLVAGGGSNDESVTVLAPPKSPANDDDASDEETLLAPPVDMDDSLIANADDATMFADVDELDSTVGGGTSRVPVISDDDIDLDLGDLTAALQKTEFPDDAMDATAERPMEPVHSSDLEEDVFAKTLAEDDDVETREMPVDNRTMTEVGTKLDLARAYIDMGDPDGARSILEEVAAEGSSSQQQEARKLLDDLPG